MLAKVRPAGISIAVSEVAGFGAPFPVRGPRRLLSRRQPVVRVGERIGHHVVDAVGNKTAGKSVLLLLRKRIPSTLRSCS